MTKKIKINKDFHFTEKEAKVDYNRLMDKFHKEMEEWTALFDKLPKLDQARVNMWIEVPGMPPKPNHQGYTFTYGTPHEHLQYEQAKYGMVWVGNFGWMDCRDFGDIVQWSEEDGYK